MKAWLFISSNEKEQKAVIKPLKNSLKLYCHIVFEDGK